MSSAETKARRASADRRTVLRAALAASASLALPAARACEFFTPNLRITHPWTRASAPGATSAIVCMKFDEVMRLDRLVLVESPVAAAAQMGNAEWDATGYEPRIDFPIPAGEVSLLDEAGIHVLLVGLKFPLEVGRSYPMSLGFERGGVFNAVLSVDFARFG